MRWETNINDSLSHFLSLELNLQVLHLLKAHLKTTQNQNPREVDLKILVILAEAEISATKKGPVR